MASNVLNNMIPGLAGQAGGKFRLPSNTQMIGLLIIFLYPPIFTAREPDKKEMHPENDDDKTL